jgi:hypothetical protein
MTQVVQHLPSKCKDLSSNPRTAEFRHQEEVGLWPREDSIPSLSLTNKTLKLNFQKLCALWGGVVAQWLEHSPSTKTQQNFVPQTKGSYKN